jgi:hypothetical protein
MGGVAAAREAESESRRWLAGGFLDIKALSTPRTISPQNRRRHRFALGAGHEPGAAGQGSRIEREIVELHCGLGLRAKRVPLSGASRYEGNGADVDGYPFGPDEAPLCGEVKAQANGEGFATLEQWLGDNDFLALRRNNAAPIIVTPWRIWARLVVRGGLK